jgi:hypothetical protein
VIAGGLEDRIEAVAVKVAVAVKPIEGAVGCELERVAWPVVGVDEGESDGFIVECDGFCDKECEGCSEDISKEGVGNAGAVE